MGAMLDVDLLQRNISPVVDGDLVTFIYRGKAESVFIAGDYNSWELQDKMQKIVDSDLLFIQKHFPVNARFDYKYIVDGSWITDPLNKHITPDFIEFNSQLFILFLYFSILFIDFCVTKLYFLKVH